MNKIFTITIVIFAIVIFIFAAIFLKGNKQIIENNIIENEPVNEAINDTNSIENVIDNSNLNETITKEKEDIKENIVSIKVDKMQTKVDNENAPQVDNKVEDNSTQIVQSPTYSDSNKDDKKVQESEPSNEQKVIIKEEPKEEIIITAEEQKASIYTCSDGHHIIPIGNTNKWFNSKQEAINYFNSTYSYWAKKWENFEIDDDVFKKNCPNRYELYGCTCGLWTMEFYYE